MNERYVLFPKTPTIESYMKEVILAETYNYRSGKPVLGGLFGEDIFGPTTDYKCGCTQNPLTGLRNRGMICDKCGVELMPANERSNRFGYIRFHIPLVHPLNRSYLCLIAPDLDKKFLELFMKQSWQFNVTLDESPKSHLRDETGRAVAISIRELDGTETEETIGAIGLINAVAALSAEQTRVALSDPDLKAAPGLRKLVRRMTQHHASFDQTFFLYHMLVSPPNHRPLLLIDNSYKMDTINQVYLTILRRNKRMAALMTLEDATPEAILKEWSILNKVLSAFYFGKMTLSGEEIEGRIKKLSDKDGWIRGNLLGKRVDYSGRTVIACGPDLKFGHLGVPEYMAYQLLKLHILQSLKKQGMSISRADDFWAKKDPRAYAAMYEWDGKVRVMMNRQPTLWRYGVQSYLLDIIPGKVIRVHPAYTNSFNADFDGDTVALYLMHGEESVYEQEMLLAPQNNILSATSGDVLIGLSQEFTFGMHMIK